MTAATVVSSYEEAQAAGEQALSADAYTEAYAYFSLAHTLGRPVRAQHLRAHRALIRAGWRARRPDWVASNAVYLAGAFVFEWGRPPMDPRR